MVAKFNYAGSVSKSSEHFFFRLQLSGVWCDKVALRWIRKKGMRLVDWSSDRACVYVCMRVMSYHCTVRACVTDSWERKPTAGRPEIGLGTIHAYLACHSHSLWGNIMSETPIICTCTVFDVKITPTCVHMWTGIKRWFFLVYTTVVVLPWRVG